MLRIEAGSMLTPGCPHRSFFLYSASRSMCSSQRFRDLSTRQLARMRVVRCDASDESARRQLINNVLINKTFMSTIRVAARRGMYLVRIAVLDPMVPDSEATQYHSLRLMIPPVSKKYKIRAKKLRRLDGNSYRKI
ncbi:unnamed protein product [Trichogramma brassicae]|uniref:Uncharacterized protein n=1 Tax=Trichogramma brassicae TaxID=86971 RepID=A0A6H5IV16_9HYME|nr:unnamed protein product [Trichogramma brassicae]